MLHSLQTPKLLAGHDFEVIGDGVAPCRPLLWQSSAEEIEESLDEEREARMERVVRHFPVHDAPEPLDRAWMRRMGGQEDELDAAVRSLRPMPGQAGVMVAGVVRDDMDPLVAGIAGLQLLKQRAGGSGVDPLGRDRGKVSFSA